ncbi:hypothetical protein LR48_Vigan04g160600 [Vigna angularis]|uniref:Uncharacterized protein n=1 Tax=Phaseolus angularis TaxID=3914 RepID=A0A0L9UF92_PHAAN|nr:hypothetical protein LR48_Vigan04g160600 [Vigna angularis]
MRVTTPSTRLRHLILFRQGYDTLHEVTTPHSLLQGYDHPPRGYDTSFTLPQVNVRSSFERSLFIWTFGFERSSLSLCDRSSSSLSLICHSFSVFYRSFRSGSGGHFTA